MKYMLDTNIVIYIQKRKPENVLRKLRDHLSDGLCLSAITLAELEYGAANSSDPARNQLALLQTLSLFSILPFGVEAASDYGVIRADLKRRGQPIGPNDLLIASHARSEGLTLVTNNLKEFEKVPGLKTEDWTKEE